ncbi:uncharacterized protein LOC141684909 [Apium graveolens]|uniref:uncharacterized protein LOC141684909 n=1 Tax=Apium graveolens TaxID=4045 RepID=UPI003D790D58
MVYAIPQVEVRVMEVSTSDHLPIYLQLHKHVYMPKKRRFRFENVWLKENECQQVVKEGWDDVEHTEIIEKIKSLLEKQEIYWKQRAKQFWLKEGDQNTRFFHRFALSWRKTNLIQRIKDSAGVWRETPEEIQVVIEEYFSAIFKASSVNGQLTEREEVQQVSESDNMNLISDVTEEEVKCVVFSMHPEKTPGPDGFNPAFYQSFWSVVKNDVV